MHHSHIDRFAQQDSPVHRLDARIKLLGALAYAAVLISFDRYALARLAPMAILPLAMLWFGRIPAWFALRRVLVLSPFVAMLALLSPLYDRSLQAVDFGPWRFYVAGGWLTAGNLALKFIFGLLALTAVMCATPFSLLLEAMRRLGAPKALVMQLGFVYRYVFLLIDQAMRIRRARDFRGAAAAGFWRRLGAVGGIIGSLFIRTLDRSERIGLAMAARGFRGEPHSLGRLRLSRGDLAFALGLAAYLAACRLA